MDNSQIMKTMHYLTDVYGPRLTGSPNHENAAKWAVKQMEIVGLQERQARAVGLPKVANSKVVREGWLNEKATGHIISPVKDNLVFEVLAWTPSTKGTVTGAGRSTSSRRRARSLERAGAARRRRRSGAARRGGAAAAAACSDSARPKPS